MKIGKLKRNCIACPVLNYCEGDNKICEFKLLSNVDTDDFRRYVRMIMSGNEEIKKLSDLPELVLRKLLEESEQLSEAEVWAEYSETLKVKYIDSAMKPLGYVGGKSDWIDLRSAEDIELKAGDFYIINLGVAIHLPAGYEAYIVPRSSTFKNYGIIQTNSAGIIDETYCGDEDWWKIPVRATRDTVIHKNDRICQFRIMRHQPRLIFETVASLGNDSRGGFGSTGRE